MRSSVKKYKTKAEAAKNHPGLWGEFGRQSPPLEVERAKKEGAA